jgi:hypothetical protein
MRDFHIGDRVTFFGRAYFVRGFSPMSAPRRSIQLEDADTGEGIEIPIDDLARALSVELRAAADLGVPFASASRRVRRNHFGHGDSHVPLHRAARRTGLALLNGCGRRLKEHGVATLAANHGYQNLVPRRKPVIADRFPLPPTPATTMNVVSPCRARLYTNGESAICSTQSTLAHSHTISRRSLSLPSIASASSDVEREARLNGGSAFSELFAPGRFGFAPPSRVSYRRTCGAIYERQRG